MTTVDYASVPVVSGRARIPRLARLLSRSAWDAAAGRPVRIAVFGDSQETDQGGAGRRQIAYLNAIAAMTYGNAPETPIGTPVSQAKNPGSLWLLRTGRVDGTAPSVAASFRPPGFSNSGYQYLSSHTGVGLILQPDAFSLDASTQLSGGLIIDRSTFHGALDLFAFTRASASGQILCDIIRTTSPDGSYFGTPVFSATTSMSLVDSTVRCLRQTVGGAYTFGTDPYLMARLRGTHPTNPVFLVGGRWRNAAAPWGCVFQSFSASGYKATDFALNHADMGEVLRAGEFDAALIAVGGNDCYTASRTAVQFKSDLNALIDWLRGTVFRDASLPIIIRSEPVRILGTAGQDAQFALYPSAAAEIEAERSEVLALNTRRAVERSSAFHANSMLMTGLTNRGAWAASTAYAVNDRVHIANATGQSRHFRCVTAHTSTAADAPSRNNDSSAANWQEIRQHADSTTTFDGADDATHWSSLGSQTIANALWTALQGAVARASVPSWRRIGSRL